MLLFDLVGLWRVKSVMQIAGSHIWPFRCLDFKLRCVPWLMVTQMELHSNTWSSPISLCIHFALVHSRTIHRYWSLNGWSNHPFLRSLLPYNSTWTSLAADVETEFRRIDKICLQTSPLRFALCILPLYLLFVTPSSSFFIMAVPLLLFNSISVDNSLPTFYPEKLS